MTGTVKWFDEAKGYGFLTAADGSEHFCHKSDVRDDSPLLQGEQVVFDIGSDGRRSKAVTVRRFHEELE